jgi:hypothetical protein
MEAARMSARQMIFAWLCLASPVLAQPLTLPLNERPDWLRRDGIVMAGSWEALMMRARIFGGKESFTPTAQQRADYDREHSPETIARLKDMGVNFVMIHCYRGAGMQAERESLADAARFAKRYHDAGLKVGVYNYSGTLFWELFEELGGTRRGRKTRYLRQADFQILLESQPPRRPGVLSQTGQVRRRGHRGRPAPLRQLRGGAGK